MNASRCLLAAAVLLTACTRVGFSTEQIVSSSDGFNDQSTDGSGPADLPWQPEISIVEDRGLGEASPPLDLTPPDTSKPDAAVPDTSKPDTVVPDPDTSPKDTLPDPDSAKSTACAPGSGVFFETLGTNMVVCNSTASYVTQCKAATLCNKAQGWHLCTASEFHARGGQTKQAQTSAWMAGCYTSKTAASTPADLDGICSGGCGTEPMISPWTAWWSCDGSGPIDVVRKQMAMRTGNLPRRVATNSAAFCAIWVGVFTSNTHPAALCCL